MRVDSSAYLSTAARTCLTQCNIVDSKSWLLLLFMNTSLFLSQNIMNILCTQRAKLGHNADCWHACWSLQDVMRPREVVNAPDALHSVNNSQLPEGQKLMSRNQAHALVMQGDGNLVYYNGGGAPWASDTGGRGSGPYCLVMQGDNNAVIYGQGGVPIWGSNTNGRGVGPAQLVMQDDGNIVIYDAKGKVLWARK